MTYYEKKMKQVHQQSTLEFMMKQIQFDGHENESYQRNNHNKIYPTKEEVLHQLKFDSPFSGQFIDKPMFQEFFSIAFRTGRLTVDLLVVTFDITEMKNTHFGQQCCMFSVLDEGRKLSAIINAMQELTPIGTIFSSKKTG